MVHTISFFSNFGIEKTMGWAVHMFHRHIKNLEKGIKIAKWNQKWITNLQIGSLTTFLTVETEVKPPETARELADVGQRQSYRYQVLWKLGVNN